MKTESVTCEIWHCGECSEVDLASKGRWKCLRKNKIVPDAWGEIPKWCPLEDSGEKS